MTESRKQLIARIAQTNEHLADEQVKVQQFKSSLKVNHPLLMTTLILAPAFIVGWQMGSKKNDGSVTNRLVKIGLMAASTQFQSQLNSFFTND
ncbi:MAG: hypothetical protein EPN84_02645 [Legionella sp.]|nr:MAG: hypothetical protein EPN84_02645 [Legionella sp.]